MILFHGLFPTSRAFQSWAWAPRSSLRCFDIVFQRPYRYFSIALKLILSLSDRYKISPMTDYRLKFVKIWV